MNKPSITVAIVNWNSGDLLIKSLNCLLGQTCQPDKIIVIDNGSTDDSITYAQNITGTQIKKLYRNLGFAAANNIALSECGTEYIALLNPDAFPEEEWLESMVNAANIYPDFAAFGSQQLVYATADLIDGIGDVYHISGRVWRDRHGKHKQCIDLVQHEIFSPCAAAALYNCQSLMNVGGFDEDYFCYIEDVDLGFRLRLAGYKAMYVPDAVVHHVGSASTGGRNSDFYVYHGHRNLVWTYLKNMPGFLLWIFLPYHILLNIISILVFVIRGQGHVIFRAKWDAIKGIPAMWRKRKIIQSNRVASLRDIWRVLNKQVIPWNHRK